MIRIGGQGGSRDGHGFCDGRSRLGHLPILGVGWSPGEPAVVRHDGRYLPTADHRVNPRIGVREQHSASADRNIAHRIEGYGVVDIVGSAYIARQIDLIHGVDKAAR